MADNEISQPTPEGIKLMERAAVRTKGDQLIAATDYTQAADSPLSEAQRAEVADYRQALRDVLPDGADPFAVRWPEKPVFLK